MLFLIIIISALILFWVYEYIRHQRNVNRIQHRIHVNGTRGKSSVTRLIAAGLRQGENLRVVAKTTGTQPRFILEDGTESSIVRQAGANIIEQKYIFRHAMSRKPNVMVIECMAVNPVFQWITERQFVRSTISVITNVRMDHTDLMGDTLESIGRCLGNSIPENSVCFTSEIPMFPLLKEIAESRNTKIFLIKPEDYNITPEELKGFSYIEHLDNISLSLAVCEHLGVPRDKALVGMQNAIPDPGALKKYCCQEGKKELNFYNVFAANDPNSTEFIFNMIAKNLTTQQIIIVLNSRADRYYRSLQLLEVAKKLESRLDYLLLTGERCVQIYQDAVGMGLNKNKLVRIGELPVQEVYAKCLQLTRNESHIMGIGNIAGERGYGGQIVKIFAQKSKEAIK